MDENASFGPNLAVYGPKIQFFEAGSKTFGTHITEKPPTQLVRIVFWSGIGSNGPKMQVMGQIWPKIHFLWGWSKTFGILISGN